MTKNLILEESVRDTFPKFNITPPVFRSQKQLKFVKECWSALQVILWSTDLSQTRRLLYQVLVEWVTSDSLCVAWLVNDWVALFLVLDASNPSFHLLSDWFQTHYFSMTQSSMGTGQICSTIIGVTLFSRKCLCMPSISVLMCVQSGTMSVSWQLVLMSSISHPSISHTYAIMCHPYSPGRNEWCFIHW